MVWCAKKKHKSSDYCQVSETVIHLMLLGHALHSFYFDISFVKKKFVLDYANS